MCVALALVAAVLVVVFRDGDDGASASRVRPDDLLTERQLALVRSAVPDPGCGGTPAPVPADRSLVALDVMRVDGTCLSVVTEYLPASEVDRRRAALASDPAVVVAAVAPPMKSDAADDKREEQWPLDLLGVPEKSVDLPWPDGTGVVVAVIDSGVDAGHPDLGGAVVGRRHYEGEGALDANGHGTHVAGIVSARRDNGGTVGVAPGVSVLDVPVKLQGMNENGPSWWTGLTWAVNHGADVANMSFGGPLSQYQQAPHSNSLEFGAAAVEFAHEGDVVLVASAGNCGQGGGDCEDRNQRKVPNVFEGVVSVGAVEDNRKVTGYSTKNEDVDLVAPGGEQTSVMPPGHGGGLVLSLAPGGDYAKMRGTSQAAPHVAAAAAIARFVRPEATADEISRALLDSADLNGVAEDDRGKVGTGHGLLNIPGMVDRIRTGPPPGPTSSPTAPTTSPAGPGSVAGRTQVAYVQDGTLYVYDGTTSHPVRAADRPPRWLTWSTDHKLLVGADDRTLFSWAGPGTKPVEKPCDACAVDSTGAPALVSDVAVTDPATGKPTGDLVLRMDADGKLTRYNAHTLDEIGSSVPAFPANSVGSKFLRGSVGGKLVVQESGGAHGLEQLWLVDPVSGEVGSRRTIEGLPAGTVATSAAGDRVAFVSGYSSCGSPEAVYVLRGSDLADVAKVAPPPGVAFDAVFFNGGTMYADTSSFTISPGQPCKRTDPAGLWRLAGTTWERVNTVLADGRPVEGRPGGAAPGWVVVRDGRAVLQPAATGDPDAGDLGRVGDQVWSTPTATEIPLR